MRKKTSAAIAVLSAAALGLTACGSANDQKGSSGGGGGGGGGDKKITIAYIDWDEDVAVSHLWKKVLEDKGYTVTLQHVSDAGPVYVGLDKGQVDLFLDGWLPLTHQDYWKKYGSNLTDINHWYDNAKLTIAVPEYMNISSIDELPKVKGQVNNKIVGIEPGAGLTKATNKALNEYNLGMELQTSSTPAMLAALKKATESKQPVVVTLWRPHWAYSAFPVKDLKDPKGVMGSAEQIHAIGSKDFSKNLPEVEQMLKKYKMNDEQLASLEKSVLQDHKDDPQAGVKAWLEKNPDFVKSLG